MTDLKLNGKKVGVFRSDRTFITQRQEDRHYFKKYNGLGMSHKLILRLKAINCKKIVILYTRSDGLTEMLFTTPEIFQEFGFLWAFDKEDKQYILPLIHFNNERKDAIDFRFYSYKTTSKKEREHLRGNSVLEVLQ